MKKENSNQLAVWPARLDLLQSATGLLLALFMWFHMFFVSSILLGMDVFWHLARFFEGYHLLGYPLPLLVSLFVAAIFLLLVIHALLALRKFPASWQQYRNYASHMGRMGHNDTNLWMVQVVTGFVMFFLAPVHLYIMLTQPEMIGPFASSDRVWSGRLWPLYLMLLFAVELHGVVGLYRLAVKWGWFSASDPNRTRTRLKRAKWVLTLFFLTLGLMTLATFIKIGIDHSGDVGERYTPASVEVEK